MPVFYVTVEGRREAVLVVRKGKRGGEKRRGVVVSVSVCRTTFKRENKETRKNKRFVPFPSFSSSLLA